MYIENIGSKIRTLRKKKKLTLNDLSKKAKISVSFLSDIENGRSKPSLERLNDISKALETTTSYLLGEDEIKTLPSKSNNENDIDVFQKLGKIIKRDSKPLTEKDKKKLLKLIEAAWPDEDDEDEDDK